MLPFASSQCNRNEARDIWRFGKEALFLSLGSTIGESATKRIDESVECGYTRAKVLGIHAG
jgi:hypothetical protein